MKPREFTFLIILLCWRSALTQGVGVGTTNPDSSALVEVKSTTQGMLIPRMTTSQRNLIDQPAEGLLVFDMDKNTVFMFDGTSWQPLMFATNLLSLPVSLVKQVSDASDGDRYGNSVAIDGNYAIVGAIDDDVDTHIDRGSAYILYRDNGIWEEQDKISSILGFNDDAFGYSVDISGDYAIVGAPYHDGVGFERGSAFIFKRNGNNWQQLARLNAPGGDPGDQFGSTVSIDGDYAVVGAYNADVTGRAFVFYKGAEWVTGQAHQAELIPSAPLSNSFGTSVSINGSEIVVGASSETVSGQSGRGAAYIYTRTDSIWTQTARLIASDGSENEHFGYSVNIDGDYTVVGAAFDGDPPNIWTGSAYVFYRDTGWANNQPHQVKLLAPDGNYTDLFGSRVTIAGDYIAIGALWKEMGPFDNVGKAYLYKRYEDTWYLHREIEDDNGTQLGEFSNGLAIDGFNILIGAPGKNNGKGQLFKLNIE